jgi:hypothetical protein
VQGAFGYIDKGSGTYHAGAAFHREFQLPFEEIEDLVLVVVDVRRWSEETGGRWDLSLSNP